MAFNFKFALCALVILGSRVVSSLASDIKFNFTDVQQCEPVTISISLSDKVSGNNPALLPTSLSIIPFNSNPVVVPITNPAAVSGGVYLTFLPFVAGTNFIASLDDEKGENIAKVSDVIRVLPSSGQPQDNSSCIPPENVDARRQFIMEKNPYQCEEFAIRYNVSAVSQAPIIRLFNPKGPTLILNHTSDDQVNGIANYVMNFGRGKEIVLLIDGGNGIRETTPLLTVSGDTSSLSACLGNQSSNVDSSTVTGPIASKAVLIGSATGGGVVVLIAVCIALFIARERKRRQHRTQFSFDPSRLQRPADEEKAAFPSPTFLEQPPLESSINRLSDTKGYLAPQDIPVRKDSLASWGQFTPEDQRLSMSPTPRSNLESREFQAARESTDQLSLNSLDIEGMLNMATMQTETRSRQSSGLLLYSHSESITPPSPTAPLTISRRTLKVNSDVPADPHSMILSHYSFNSVNPFAEDGNANEGYQSPIFSQSSSTRLKLPLSSTVTGLPVSPRDVRANAGRQSMTRSSGSSADWYGIAR